MSAKHTPGPWRFGPVSKGTLDIATGERSEMRSAGFAITAKDPAFKSWVPIDVARSENLTEANARLIAAAPELLEALETLVRQAEQHGAVGVYWDEARAAIAKAKGEA